MFKYEQMRELIKLTDENTIMSEVEKLSEGDAKLELFAVLMSWRTGNEIDKEIDANLRRRIGELEAK